MIGYRRRIIAMILIKRFRVLFGKAIVAGLAAFVLAGCIPPAANLQDARMVGKENVRLAGSWSGLKDTGEGGEKFANDYAGLLGIGTSDRTEIQFRVDHFDFVDDEEGLGFVSIGPKFGLSENRLALVVPLGVYGHNGIEWGTVQIHPGLLGSLPVGRFFELNGAASLFFPFDQDYYTWFNLGIGVGLSTDLDSWAVLPQISYSVCLDESDVDPVFSYGFALVYCPGR
jgi:hypothetical protein